MNSDSTSVDTFVSRVRSQGPNTQSAMRLEFRREADVKKAAVTSYVKQAIAVEKAGRKVESQRELELPKELTHLFKQDKKLAKAFSALTPGRQRGYVLHFAGAKRPATRTARIEKCAPRILAGLGLHDR